MLVSHCRMRYSVVKEPGRKEGCLSHQTSCKSVTGNRRLDRWLSAGEEASETRIQGRTARSRGFANYRDQLNRELPCYNRVSPVTTDKSPFANQGISNRHLKRLGLGRDSLKTNNRRTF